MTPWKAVFAGLRAVNRVKRMWLVYWLWTTAFALAIVVPVVTLLFRDLGYSLYAGRIFANFDITYAVEAFTQSRGWLLSAVTPAVVLAALAFLMAGTFLAGGVLWTFRDPLPRYAPAVFYQGCGRHFGRLACLALLSLPFYSLAIMANGLLILIARKIWGHGMEARPIIVFGWFRASLFIALLLAVNLVFDYARIRLVAADEHNPFRATFGSMGLVFRNFASTAGTYMLAGSAALVLGGVYLMFSNLLPRSHWAFLVIVLLVQQVYVLGRVWTRLLFFAAQLRMYEAVTAAGSQGEPGSRETAL